MGRAGRRPGSSLAARPLAAVVEALKPKDGDEIKLHVVDAREVGFARAGGC